MIVNFAWHLGFFPESEEESKVKFAFKANADKMRDDFRFGITSNPDDAEEVLQGKVFASLLLCVWEAKMLLGREFAAAFHVEDVPPCA